MARKSIKARKESPEKSGPAQSPGVRGIRVSKGPGFADDAFVEEFFATWCGLTLSFDLPRFDAWLDALEPGPVKLDLQNRRTAAKEAFRSDPNREAEILWHLDFMNVQWHHIRRETFLLPLAREGKGLKDSRGKGGRNTAEKKRTKNSPRDNDIAKRARALIQANEATSRTVSGKLVEDGMNRGLGVKRIREILREKGVR